MGPDATTTIPAGEVFFAPIGTPLPEAVTISDDWVKIGAIAEGITALGEAATSASAVLFDFSETVKSITYQFSGLMHPEIHRMFFGGRQPKRSRKRYDRAHTQLRKVWRLEQRDKQRTAVGINSPR